MQETSVKPSPTNLEDRFATLFGEAVAVERPLATSGMGARVSGINLSIPLRPAMCGRPHIARKRHCAATKKTLANPGPSTHSQKATLRRHQTKNVHPTEDGSEPHGMPAASQPACMQHCGKPDRSCRI